VSLDEHCPHRDDTVGVWEISPTPGQLAGLDLRHRQHGGGPDPAGKGMVLRIVVVNVHGSQQRQVHFDFRRRL